MAIVGSLVAYGVYRLLAGQSPLTATRRVIAAGLAGYIAINASALLAGIEFGLQPLLFTDATGAPLYAPYPMHIAIPAMMICHLTFAGLAELVVTGGLVAYLQRSDPMLLKLTAPGVASTEAGLQAVAHKGGWGVTRSLWIGLAVLMIATPLGLLAAGTAWGEWGASDFANPTLRAEIAKASGATAPAAVPAGLERLSSVWTAPLRLMPPLLCIAKFLDISCRR